jgi:hypothetical protein
MKSTKTWMVAIGLVAQVALMSSCKKSGKESDNTPRTPIPDEFVGTYYAGDVSSTNVYNPGNGSWNNSVGNGESFTFNSNGTFEFGYNFYNYFSGCSNVAMAYRSGTVVVEGDKFTLYDTKSKLMERHSCNPGTNYDRDNTKYTEVLYVQPAVDQFGNYGLNIKTPDSDFTFHLKKS